LPRSGLWYYKLAGLVAPLEVHGLFIRFQGSGKIRRAVDVSVKPSIEPAKWAASRLFEAVPFPAR
jgi:hypothetical protein